ncbi:MAG: Rieske 2Fe-2S domain-containing protein [Chitinispirillaceae bacterium]|jgi:Rieske Fe-S protein
MENKNFSRREFIATVGKSAAAIAVLAPVVGSNLAAMGKSVPVAMEPIALDLTKEEYKALAQTGGALKIPNPHDAKKPIIVTRSSETTVAAFSSKCTHWGCEVSLPVNNVITCPCHGAAYDANGKVIHGPARKDLKTFSATLNGTIITIKEVIDK